MSDNAAYLLLRKDNEMKRLTADNVNDIKICYALGVFTQQELADWFGVSQSTVSRAVNRGQKE